jgi:hypothetical protein
MRRKQALAAGMRSSPAGGLHRPGTDRPTGARVQSATVYVGDGRGEGLRRRGDEAGFTLDPLLQATDRMRATDEVVAGGASMANHASTRTTQLYDRRSDDVTLDEAEGIIFLGDPNINDISPS